jgi:hypothetical protein
MPAFMGARASLSNRFIFEQGKPQMLDTNRTTWDFIANTYWYVTPPDLPALLFSSADNLLTWEGDQTVWHISGYKNGYFWGAVSTLTFAQGDANSAITRPPGHSVMVGTVTAGGQVQISFFQSSASGDSVTTGFGQMTQVAGQWAFQMQMNTPAGSNQIFHWANMMQTKEGEASWDKLPGVKYSVPEMLDGASYPQFDQG